MARGNWSFIHEWTIYDYLMARYDEGNLRLKNVIQRGQLLGRTKWIRVDHLDPITSTGFPDIESIKLKGNKTSRPAEVKFSSSNFKYRSSPKAISNYQKFKSDHGFILVLHHDHLPSGLVDDYPDIDVFEVDQSDFISFCRENFVRLLNRQIKQHTESKVWIMYQGPNFNLGDHVVKPARDSKIWCPTENLTGFDLSIGDRILFIKTIGASTFDIQKAFLKQKEINEKWKLTEVFIAEVRSKIYSRHEFIQLKKRNSKQRLWLNDDQNKNGLWRWNRVFEFRKINSVRLDEPMSLLYNNRGSKEFVHKIFEAYCFGKSRELSLKDYQSALEVIASIR